MTDAEYQAWRARFPWTDEQFAEAVLQAEAQNQYRSEYSRRRAETAAAWVRSGHLSTVLLRLALPFLVKRCELCERKALYRLGIVGRCSVHRDVKSASMERWKATKEHRQGTYSEALNEEDRFRRAAGKFHQARGLGKRGRK